MVCFSSHGKVLWRVDVSEPITQRVSFGDIDHDGRLDVVFSTLAGTVWALSGVDGQPLPSFPIKTGGRIVAPITLVNLDPSLSSFIEHVKMKYVIKRHRLITTHKGHLRICCCIYSICRFASHFLVLLLPFLCQFLSHHPFVPFVETPLLLKWEVRHLLHHRLVVGVLVRAKVRHSV